MAKKPKSQTCSTGWCKNHLLEITPFRNSECYYRKKIRIRLCPKFSSISNSFHKAMPIINQDRKYYTPCFILQQQRKYYNQNDSKLLNTHNIKLQSEGEGTIMVAKHGRKKNYCSVCKADYLDYLEHVQENSHKEHLRGNKFSRFILETEVDLERKQKMREKESREIILQSKLVDQTNEVEKQSKNYGSARVV